MPAITIIKFSINNWEHLYSLQQAILNNEQSTGKSLSIEGVIRNEEHLDNHSTAIKITFNQVDHLPEYTLSSDHQIILGQMTRLNNNLESIIPVNACVFAELRRNLMEYSDIEGIHIVVSMGVLLEQETWPARSECSVVKLDYAMKGDS